MTATRACPAVPKTGESGHSASPSDRQAKPLGTVRRRAHDLNYKIELLITAAVGDMQSSA
jgi:hypothetical protein